MSSVRFVARGRTEHVVSMTTAQSVILDSLHPAGGLSQLTSVQVSHICLHCDVISLCVRLRNDIIFIVYIVMSSFSVYLLTTFLSLTTTLVPFMTSHM